ncbi:uncharacterized protein LOC18444225 isoform X2 [Amborella trichopoda]|uniref:uncharacterized protein LOC18444225 isoform X2 n=1 Tax=Amborella trichopoda TaxID=13333 RepID=UPI0005D39DC2|nr:uncharacterized protein LOC18444225 isoform X2 [Amborella trichopoda]|eukprot:XP_011627069.1 uncharacterized protein LOC18444225 isoform X2 [Amborella trichopoda]
MLLRSSSTPILGSLHSSSSDSPKTFETSSKPSCSDSSKKLFFNGGHPDSISLQGVRRTLSDSNLHGLISTDLDTFHSINPTKTRNFPHSKLQTIPSFSFYNKRDETDEAAEEENDDEEEEKEEDEESGVQLNNSIQRTVTIGGDIKPLERDFSFSKVGLQKFGELGLVDELGRERMKDPSSLSDTGPLFLAVGLGIEGVIPNTTTAMAGGSGVDNFQRSDDEGTDLERYYQKMLEEIPCNPLILRNYAQYLYQCDTYTMADPAIDQGVKPELLYMQSDRVNTDVWKGVIKGDHHRAEEFYSRAILSEPGDGEVLSQYARLIWDLHHDRERASSYFEQAVQAAPSDSHVLAAHASFLWDIDEDDEEDNKKQEFVEVPMFHGAVAEATA